MSTQHSGLCCTVQADDGPILVILTGVVKYGLTLRLADQSNLRQIFAWTGGGGLGLRSINRVSLDRLSCCVISDKSVSIVLYSWSNSLELHNKQLSIFNSW